MHPRMPKYLSPSALSIFEGQNGPEEYYLRYLCSDREDRQPQNQAMAAGSAFDAYVKNALATDLLGANNISPHLRWPDIFETQVEPQNRVWGIEHGKNIYQQYVSSGAYHLLLKDLTLSLTPPRFEFEVQAIIGGVPLLGKPDIFYVDKNEACNVEYDFKVNGYCSKAGARPMAGFLRLMPGTQAHKDAMPIKYRGVLIDGYSFLESRNKQWAEQLASYSWMQGAQVGDENVIAIDQLACKEQVVSVALHRSRVSKAHQLKLLARYQHLWSLVNSVHFFKDLNAEDSLAKQQLLHARALTMRDDPSFKQMSGR